jgi:hypothetical protein
LEHQPGEQDHATHTHHADERATDLRHPEGGEWNAAEGEREAHGLDQRMRRGPSDHPPRAGRRHHRGHRVEHREHEARNDISRCGELHHPAHPQIHPSGPERQPEPESHTTCRRLAEGDVEQEDPRKASGQKPHGGIDSATSVPAPRANAGRASRAIGVERSWVSPLNSPTPG